MKIYFIFGIYRLKKVYKKQEIRNKLEVIKEQKKYEVKKIIRKKNEKFKIK